MDHLLEHLGNLDRLAGFKTMMKASPYSDKTAAIRDGLGRGSKTETMSYDKSSAAKAVAMMATSAGARGNMVPMAERVEAAAFVVDDEPVLLLTFDKEKQSWTAELRPYAALAVRDDKSAGSQWKAVVKSMMSLGGWMLTDGDYAKAAAKISGKNAENVTVRTSQAAIPKLIAAIAAKAFKEGHNCEWMLVRPDLDREAANKTRSAAQSGRIPRAKSGFDWADEKNKYKMFDKEGGQGRHIKTMRSELKFKLEGFKAGRAAKFETAEQAVAAIREKGFFEKFSIGEWPFKLKGVEGRLDNLLDKRHFDSPNYPKFGLKYEIDPSAADKYREYKRQFYVKGEPEEETEKRARAVRNFEGPYPPPLFYIVFNLVGGTVAPTGFLAGDSVWF